MNDSNHTYHNLQEYLESCFGDIDIVTDEMILQVKQEWRKIYLSRYQKRYRERYLQISFRISKKQYRELELLAKEEKIKVTTYIKRLVTTHKTTTFKEVSQYTFLLLQAIDMVEEAHKEQEEIDTIKLLSLLEQMHSIVQ